MRSLAGKTLFVTGASRGIGLAIAKRAAADGANVVIAAKTATPHPKLPGTIFTAAAEIEAAGGKALPIVCDVRTELRVEKAIEQAVETFGGIDIVVNNASAISLTPTLHTPVKRYDLMMEINVRGTWMVTKLALPHLLKASNPHVLVLSPPINLDPRWTGAHPAYTLSKYGMSLLAHGFAEEFRGRVAVNALWPRTTIATAAVENLLGGDEMIQHSRTPEIMADAAWAVLTRDKSVTGNFFIDDEVLAEEGITDLTKYAVDPAHADELAPDLFL